MSRSPLSKGRLLEIVAGAAFSIVSFAGCSESDAQPRLVVLYAPCTVQRAALGSYSEAAYDRTITPHLDRFAKQSVTFENHYTESPSSGIAYAALFSGGQADHHGIYRHPTELHPEVPLLAEAYRDAGYETFFWNAHEMADAKLGYDRGVAPENVVAEPLAAASPRFIAILDKLAAEPDFRAFVVTNFTVSHGPYEPELLGAFLAGHPERATGLDLSTLRPLLKRYERHHLRVSFDFDGFVAAQDLTREQRAALIEGLRTVYASRIAHLDALFGAVVAAIDDHGLSDSSLIAFTADHGELLYREGVDFVFSHSMSLEPEALHVPLVIRLPEQRRSGEVYTGISRSIDVFPTLAGLSRIRRPELPGVDLSAAVLGKAAAPDLDAFAHTTVLAATVVRKARRRPAVWQKVLDRFPSAAPEWMWVSLRRGEQVFKLRRRSDAEWRIEAFDVVSDPLESVDVFDAAQATHAAAAADLRSYKRRLVADYERATGGGVRGRLPLAREEERLRALGYVE